MNGRAGHAAVSLTATSTNVRALPAVVDDAKLGRKNQAEAIVAAVRAL